MRKNKRVVVKVFCLINSYYYTKAAITYFML